MRAALGMITVSRAEDLLRHRPLALRSEILGRECREHLVVADLHWSGRAIDLQVGDMLQLRAGAKIEGGCTEEAERRAESLLARAVRPGIGRVAAPEANWSAYLRVSRENYSGRSVYRFLEEAEDAE